MGGLLGSYLSEPETEKESFDESSDKLICGASSMQGWRVSHEDAHNCILNYDDNTAFFAVYDGHGGPEVAQYCAQNLPQFIKETTAYKEGKIEEALIDGFLGFDATIATEKVVEVLKTLANDKEVEEDSDEEENVNNLYEEAAMPIEQVIEKYASNLKNAKNIKDESDKVKSPPKVKKDNEITVDTSAGCSSEPSQSCSSTPCGDGVSSSSEVKSSDKVNDSGDKEEKNEIDSKKNIESEKSTPDSSNMKEGGSSATSSSSAAAATTTTTQNGDIPIPDSEAQSKNVVTSSSLENGEVSKKGKGKAIIKPDAVKPSRVSPRKKTNALQLYQKLLDFQNDSDDDDDDEDSEDEDKTFEGPEAESSGDEDEGVNAAIEVDGSEEDSSEEDEEDVDEEDEEYEEATEFQRNMKEEPGSDSGSTAVVALLKGNELYVANAGDSRCIVCRNGKAVEMSFDHKPEDEPEHERITKAGGQVFDGRVNGGLNLSRAIGDHAYKQNKELSDKEQMITALPDVKTLTIKPNEDEFLFLACDGIWNFMSSQEVVDFVRPKLQEGREKLSTICEEMFDHCLAPDTLGDGTGCDNMTAIIVQFKSNILKRAASPAQSNDSEPKRAKTEATDSSIDTTV